MPDGVVAFIVLLFVLVATRFGWLRPTAVHVPHHRPCSLPAMPAPADARILRKVLLPIIVGNQ
jgi:hypothetical protein